MTGDPPLPWWTPPMPIGQVHVMPIGCICPPGANRDCERPDCPRKNPYRDTTGQPCR